MLITGTASVGFVQAVCFSAWMSSIAFTQTNSVPTHAKGTFDVKVTPMASDDAAATAISRLSLDKQYHGDLDATARGQMLGAMSPVEGSGGYVAIELVSGTLNGRKGTFLLQHIGSMRKNEYRITVTVVPDSGTGELAGLSGTMVIIIEGTKHSYDFAYALGS